MGDWNEERNTADLRAAGGRNRVTDKTDTLLTDEASILDLDELKPLMAEGAEKGVLTFEQIAGALEEVEVSKEQVAELHGYLEEQGIDVVGADGKAARSESTKLEAAAEARRAQVDAPKKAELDLTVEPSLDSLRLYLRSIGRVPLLTAEREVALAKRIERGGDLLERQDALLLALGDQRPELIEVDDGGFVVE